jgi:Na+-transporting NADH:ubiquinone oxidoreductase subunit NqrD
VEIQASAFSLILFERAPHVKWIAITQLCVVCLRQNCIIGGRVQAINWKVECLHEFLGKYVMNGKGISWQFLMKDMFQESTGWPTPAVFSV